MSSRAEILNRIDAERARQLELVGSENDLRNSPNEWAAIAGKYLFSDIRRGMTAPERHAFEDSLIKAAAVILAALEATDTMQALGYFSETAPPGLDGFALALSSVAAPKR